MTKLLILSAVGLALTAVQAHAASSKAASFKEDLDFLKKYLDVIVLSDPSGNAQVAVVPAYQGRVMTSAADGVEGVSFGWINRELIESKKIVPHINVFGGEDRFWLGPEGGQFAVFFAKGAPKFDLENWQTPPVIDSEAYDVVSKTASEAVFRKKAKISNWTGTTFDLQIDRAIRLLDRQAASKFLGVDVPEGLKMVAFESDNKITNTGKDAWKKDSGLISIWILGMFNPSPATTIVIPFKAGDEGQLGPKVNDAYFGEVPADRLIVKDNVLFFSADGTFRSKIGLSPKRALPFAGSYDAANKVLTIVQYTKPDGVMDYVNSMWEMQKEPYAGDVVNSYNDGPPAPGKKPLGPFYELETSSPAAALAPNASLQHMHRTFHFTGDEAVLDKIARTLLTVGLDEIKGAFKK